VRELSVASWVATIGVGLALFSTWLARRSRNGRGQGRKRFRLSLIVSHLTLGFVGLGAWLAFLATDLSSLKWASAAVLVVVLSLGSVQFNMWRSRRLGRLRATPKSWDLPPLPARDGEIPPEQHFPVAVVVLHGLFAGVTAVFVALVIAGGDKWL